MKENNKHMEELIKEIVDLHYVNTVVEQNNYDERMSLLLSELLDYAIEDDETSPSSPISDRDKPFYEYKNHLRYFGVDKYDVFQILGDVTKVME